MNNDPRTREFFRGVMPRDFLPKQLEEKSLYVINLSASTGADSQGSHWVLISTMDSEFSAYICSLGTPPVHTHVIDSLFSVNNRVVWSDFKNQGESTVCSMHVLFSAHMIARGHKLIDIMTQFFTNETFINDRAITEIITTAHSIEGVVPIIDWSFF